MKTRNKKIIITSIIGIITNIFLAIIKIIVGIFTFSLAVTLDAINNLSDALSSVITIIGTALAGKKADKKHPLGYGRTEYLATSLIAIIVLYAGITCFVDSIKGIIDKTNADYNLVMLIILGICVLGKVLLGLYFYHQSKKLSSSSLHASGIDALFDSLISLSTIIAAIIYINFGLSLEAYLGIIIAIIIIKNGIEILIETVNNLLGKRPEKEISDNIKNVILSFNEVLGVYDLFIHNYGPDNFYASCHIELSDDYLITDVDKLTRQIQNKVYQDLNIILTAVGIYAVNFKDEEINNIHNIIKDISFSHQEVLELHGFYLEKENKYISFDLILDFKTKNEEDIINKIKEEILIKLPNYNINIILDKDVSD